MNSNLEEFIWVNDFLVALRSSEYRNGAASICLGSNLAKADSALRTIIFKNAIFLREVKKVRCFLASACQAFLLAHSHKEEK